MSEHHEHIELLLKGAVPPEYQSEEHRQQLRAQILSRLEPGRAGNQTWTRWKTAALGLGLVCLAAAATELGFQVHRFHFEGRARDGAYIFTTTEPETTYGGTNRHANGTPLRVSTMWMTGIKTDSGKELDAAGIEQQRKDLEEIDALRQRNARELLSVTDIAVNGKVEPRAYTFNYVRADGRKETVCEGAPGPASDPSPAQRERAQEEIAGLRQRGQREVTKVIATEFDGQVVQRTLFCRYSLSDGREETIGEGDPELPAAANVLTPEQSREVALLGAALKQRELLGSEQVQMYGKTFNFTRYSVTLSDGTRVVWSEGEPKSLKTRLSEADWKELHKLIAAQQGETLGTYEEEVLGKALQFTRVKYVLSDGTEVLRSYGKPGSAR
jgi:hypothetical protein